MADTSKRFVIKRRDEDEDEDESNESIISIKLVPDADGKVRLVETRNIQPGPAVISIGRADLDKYTVSRPRIRGGGGGGGLGTQSSPPDCPPVSADVLQLLTRLAKNLGKEIVNLNDALPDNVKSTALSIGDTANLLASPLDNNLVTNVEQVLRDMSALTIDLLTTIRSNSTSTSSSDTELDAPVFGDGPPPPPPPPPMNLNLGTLAPGGGGLNLGDVKLSKVDPAEAAVAKPKTTQELLNELLKSMAAQGKLSPTQIQAEMHRLAAEAAAEEAKRQGLGADSALSIDHPLVREFLDSLDRDAGEPASPAVVHSERLQQDTDEATEKRLFELVLPFEVQWKRLMKTLFEVLSGEWKEFDEVIAQNIRRKQATALQAASTFYKNVPQLSERGVFYWGAPRSNANATAFNKALYDLAPTSTGLYKNAIGNLEAEVLDVIDPGSFVDIITEMTESDIYDSPQLLMYLFLTRLDVHLLRHFTVSFWRSLKGDALAFKGMKPFVTKVDVPTKEMKENYERQAVTNQDKMPLIKDYILKKDTVEELGKRPTATIAFFYNINSTAAQNEKAERENRDEFYQNYLSLAGARIFKLMPELSEQKLTAWLVDAARNYYTRSLRTLKQQQDRDPKIKNFFQRMPLRRWLKDRLFGDRGELLSRNAYAFERTFQDLSGKPRKLQPFDLSHGRHHQQQPQRKFCVRAVDPNMASCNVCKHPLDDRGYFIVSKQVTADIQDLPILLVCSHECLEPCLRALQQQQ